MEVEVDMGVAMVVPMGVAMVVPMGVATVVPMGVATVVPLGVALGVVTVIDHMVCMVMVDKKTQLYSDKLKLVIISIHCLVY